MNVVDYLANEWCKSGLYSGDTILIHSSLSSTFSKLKKEGFKASVGDIYDSFLKAVGSKGTLIFPLFNFDFAENKFFDINSTPSQMGALTEYARLQKDSVRTGHPFYSFAIVGSKSNLFKSIDNNSGYGKDSPFAMLTKIDAKIGKLGLPDEKCMTFFHHVEESIGVEYRYYKDFTGTYIDSKNISSQKTYKLYVRDLENNVESWVKPMGDLLWKKNLYNGCKYNEGNFFSTIKANDVYFQTERIIVNGMARSYLRKN